MKINVAERPKILENSISPFLHPLPSSNAGVVSPVVPKGVSTETKIIIFKRFFCDTLVSLTGRQSDIAPSPLLFGAVVPKLVVLLVAPGALVLPALVG